MFYGKMKIGKIIPKFLGSQFLVWVDIGLKCA